MRKLGRARSELSSASIVFPAGERLPEVVSTPRYATNNRGSREKRAHKRTLCAGRSMKHDFYLSITILCNSARQFTPLSVFKSRSKNLNFGSDSMEKCLPIFKPTIGHCFHAALLFAINHRDGGKWKGVNRSGKWSKGSEDKFVWIPWNPEICTRVRISSPDDSSIFANVYRLSSRRQRRDV